MQEEIGDKKELIKIAGLFFIILYLSYYIELIDISN